MRLIASVLGRNEESRYLSACLAHLQAFCDEIVFLDDCSDDDTAAVAEGYGCHVLRSGAPEFFEHEGRTRNRLLNYTLRWEPSHVIAIDLDEFVSDGQRLRSLCEQGQGIWTLSMEEVWKADPDSLYLRVDGKWGPRKVPMLYSVPANPTRAFRIADRKIACGREPQPVALAAIRGRATVSDVQVLHFGWTREAERQARYDRYVTHDLGKSGGHADDHLRSIMYPDDRVTLERRDWPDSLDREAILR